ncbi:hypothetical protein Csa_015730 [Cucumis sativus]|uniref:Uncharacterized protein n=1 Tax=Cucumis sativus TaxID=3659 RepID=A0A0A0KBT0_CUCSA|nr:hypothetical protein Csa_015730 [Cucumis sativus]
MEEELTQLTLRPFHLSNVDAFMLLLWAGNDRVMKFSRCNVFTSNKQAMSSDVGRPICVDGHPVRFVSVYSRSVNCNRAVGNGCSQSVRSNQHCLIWSNELGLEFAKRV